MRRIEALPSKHPGIAKLRGSALAFELDDELQAIAEQTSSELDAPMAAVTLILERVQFFRGYHGLPPELEASRATDRDVSFCQFVVRDNAMFEVNDAVNDKRVPQELVETLGVASYLGAPLRIDGEVVGAMCIADSKPRTFDIEEKRALTRFARAASERLTFLTMQPRERDRALHDRAVRPAFGEIRNRLQPMFANVATIEVALTEIAAAQKLTHHVATTGESSQVLLSLTRTDEAIAEIMSLVAELAADTEQVHSAIAALERASLMTSGGCMLVDVLESALTLAHHRTKLVGGVRCSGPQLGALRAPRAVVVNVIGAVLGTFADAMHGERLRCGIDITASLEKSGAVVRVAAPISSHSATMIVDQLQLLIEGTTDVAITLADGVLQIELATRTTEALAAASPLAAAAMT